MNTQLERSLYRYRGHILILILGVIAPLFLWVNNIQSSFLLSSPYATLSTIAQVCGILGLTLFSLNIILSGRYHAADVLFHGLDRAYRIHRFTGIAGFTLMLIHVATISLRAGISSIAELQYVWLDFTDSALTYGRLAFLGFASIITVTLFIKRLPYERLKKIHQTLGIFLLLGGLHAYAIPSDIAINQPLRWYVLGLTTLGLTSYTARTLLKRWLVKRHVFTVKSVTPLPSGVTEVVMKPMNTNTPRFIPGQFNFYRFIQPGFPQEDHPFSITAANNKGTVSISAKAVGDFTSLLPTLKPGSTALIQGPFGGFTLSNKAAHQIWVAGGIGITPFLSMARSLQATNFQGISSIHLFYSVKTQEEAAYIKELQAIANMTDSFTVHLWISNTQGPITAESISRTTSLTQKDILVCGPPPMISALRTQFIAAGIPRSRVFHERFKLL